MQMDAWQRNETGQSLEQLEGCEPKLLPPMYIGLGEPVERARLPGSYRCSEAYSEARTYRGAFLPGGADWILVRPDGTNELNVRVTLETEEADLIYLSYEGLIHSPPGGEAYWRITPRFETSADRYDWLNKIVAVGLGHSTGGPAGYWIYRIL